MIRVVATITCRPGCRGRVLAELAAIAPEVRREAGCVAYDAVVDLPAGLPRQVAERPDVVVIVEAWASLDHLRAHLAAPHMQAYRERVKDQVERGELQVLAVP